MTKKQTLSRRAVVGLQHLTKRVCISDCHRTFIRGAWPGTEIILSPMYYRVNIDVESESEPTYY